MIIIMIITIVNKILKFIKIMTRGKFGRVMKCRHNVSGEIFAAKFVTCTRREDRYVNIIIIIIIVVIIIVLVIIVTYTRRSVR